MHFQRERCAAPLRFKSAYDWEPHAVRELPTLQAPGLLEKSKAFGTAAVRGLVADRDVIDSRYQLIDTINGDHAAEVCGVPVVRGRVASSGCPVLLQRSRGEQRL